MRYTITGADRTTGQDLTQTVDAKTAAEAESIASLTMLVSKVSPGPRPTPVPVVPANDLEAAVLEAASNPEVPYARPAKRDRAAGVDWSTGLANGAWFLRILSWPVAAGAIPFVLIAMREVFDSLAYMSFYGFTRMLREPMIFEILFALLLLSAAALLRVISHAALALRHIAINAPATPRSGS